MKKEVGYSVGGVTKYSSYSQCRFQELHVAEEFIKHLEADGSKRYKITKLELVSEVNLENN